MNLIRYILDFFHINGGGVQSVKYAKGQTYPSTDETMSHVEAGFAEVVPNNDPQSGCQGAATTTAVRDVDLADVVQGVQFTPDYALKSTPPADSTTPETSSAQRPDDPAQTSPQEAAVTQS